MAKSNGKVRIAVNGGTAAHEVVAHERWMTARKKLLAMRDTSFVVVSRAPMSRIKPFKKRMGWKFKWVSSDDNDFNYDLMVSFRPGQVQYNYSESEMKITDREGASAFYKHKGQVYHTYSTYARGIDLLNSTYNWLDLTTKGRDEGDIGQFWVKFHDRYGGR